MIAARITPTTLLSRRPRRASWWLIAGLMLVAPASAEAQRISNQTAVFSALDKVTARIRKLEIPINETVRFGSLKLTPRVCYSRPPEVRPKTSTFVEVEEVLLSGDEKRIFAGWMFAESPGLNALEHPVFDVWLTGCGSPQQTAASTQAGRDATAAPTPPPQRRTRRRIRR